MIAAVTDCNKHYSTTTSSHDFTDFFDLESLLRPTKNNPNVQYMMFFVLPPESFWFKLLDKKEDDDTAFHVLKYR